MWVTPRTFLWGKYIVFPYFGNWGKWYQVTHKMTPRHCLSVCSSASIVLNMFVGESFLPGESHFHLRHQLMTRESRITGSHSCHWHHCSILCFSVSKCKKLSHSVMGSLWENSSYDCEITTVCLNSLPFTHIVAQKLDIFTHSKDRLLACEK